MPLVECVHLVSLDEECVSCQRVMRQTRQVEKVVKRFRLVDTGEREAYQPPDLAQKVRVQDEDGPKEMLAVAPGVLRTPMPEIEHALRTLRDVGAWPAAARGAESAQLEGSAIGRGAAKVALVMKDAMALGLVENTEPKGAPFRYRLTIEGAKKLLSDEVAQWIEQNKVGEVVRSPEEAMDAMRAYVAGSLGVPVDRLELVNLRVEDGVKLVWDSVRVKPGITG